jgi:hypothetical protein
VTVMAIPFMAYAKQGYCCAFARCRMADQGG